ncbi:hypothetical protein ACQP2F_19505 [Actinoplanes sp. CA-030573]|uniref:hypothetical protein n=1 Tax=Actinoplanes sp. CA-030573 TaxID=3239898 RepID=UPI003D91D4BF
MATSTLSDAFNPQRRRMPSLEIVKAIIGACGADARQAALWEAAWHLVREWIDTGRAAGPAVTTRVPRQLPPDVRGFVGRGEAVAALTGTPEKAPATVITGTAGVGKTALAVHGAYRIAGRYPDGQLYLDLGGHAGGPVITPAEALSLRLQSLGVPSDRIPVDLPLQIGLYRSVLAERRVLIVLDNAKDAAHVRPMLPSGPCSHALITSRDALTGLVVRDGVARISLDTLAAADSVELLAAHLGADRVAAEVGAAARLAELCAHLPLSLFVSPPPISRPVRRRPSPERSATSAAAICSRACAWSAIRTARSPRPSMCPTGPFRPRRSACSVSSAWRRDRRSPGSRPPSFWIEDRSELALTGTANEFADAEQARAWLSAELPNLTQAVTYAADQGRGPFAWHLAHGLRGFLLVRGSGVEKLAIARSGLREPPATPGARR